MSLTVVAGPSSVVALDRRECRDLLEIAANNMLGHYKSITKISKWNVHLCWMTLLKCVGIWVRISSFQRILRQNLYRNYLFVDANTLNFPAFPPEVPNRIVIFNFPANQQFPRLLNFPFLNLYLYLLKQTYILFRTPCQTTFPIHLNISLIKPPKIAHPWSLPTNIRFKVSIFSANHEIPNL